MATIAQGASFEFGEVHRIGLLIVGLVNLPEFEIVRAQELNLLSEAAFQGLYKIES